MAVHAPRSLPTLPQGEGFALTLATTPREYFSVLYPSSVPGHLVSLQAWAAALAPQQLPQEATLTRVLLLSVVVTYLL